MSASNFMVDVHRHYWWIPGLVLPALSVAIGLFVAFNQFSEKRANPAADVNPVGWFAACVALGAMLGGCVKLFLDRAKEDADKADKAAEKEAQGLKEEEANRERVDVKLVFGELFGHLAVGVDITNVGSVPVPVKQVRLTVKGQAGRGREFPMGRVCGKQVIRRRDGEETTPEFAFNCQLEPRTHVQFHLTFNSEDDIRYLLTAPAEDLHIEVISHIAGVVATVAGDAVQAVLREGLV